MKNFPIYLFNHGSIWNYLNKAATSPLKRTRPVVVELGIAPYLAHFAGLQTPVNFPGIAACLNPNTTLEDLAIKVPDCPYPVILAPGERMSDASIVDAWDCAGESSKGSLVGLVGLSESARLLPLIERESPLTLFWDVDFPPSANMTWLSALCDYLRNRDVESAWAGLHLYSGKEAVQVDCSSESCPEYLRTFAERIQAIERHTERT